MLSAQKLHTWVVIASLGLIKVVHAASYNLAREYSGSTFFDRWQFYNNYDNLTNGDTIFVSQAVGASAELAYVDSTTNHAIIKVDNTTVVPYNDKRNSVRITSNDSYAVGSVWVADMYHLPYGCSVWPAWWSQSPNWPVGGEIDTLEGVNLVTQNQMALHTVAGCTQTNPVQSSTLIKSTNCDHDVNDNQGCLVDDPSTSSYGAGFASAGGGVFITEFASSGISIWFFQRSAVPSSISSTSNSLDTSALGTPVANWPSSGCNIDEIFQPQNLIFDITLCGDFAGNTAIFAETCSGVCYNDYVIGNASNYDNAYFEIASVRVFQTESAQSSASASASGSNTSGSSASATQSGSGAAASSTGNGSVMTYIPWKVLGTGVLGLAVYFGVH